MAITSNELNISNKSYINKDFATIYGEVLELCSKISERWAPTSANESDPGIVLLKLAAFVADKNNYNLDKNILESFMPSATQDTSMRNLCEMNGYNMKYYRSAITPISFKYNGDLYNESRGADDSFTLPKYETVVTDDSENPSVNYTLIEDCTVAYENQWVSANAIEGTVQLLTVGDGTTVQLSNLDENNRVYFPETMVAENGIFITDIASGNVWEQVDNLNIQELGTKMFKFGYDSSQLLPYVEFPSDIASLIGKGLNIRYTTTSGVDGNASIGTLKVLSAPSAVVSNYDTDKTFDDLTDNLTITNESASTNGQNPEDIDEAYNNYKKVIGTFDTLVTCRDYANYIYNLQDETTFKEVVSNIQVSDRRTDFNYSNNITTYNPSYGSYLVSNVSNADITPYDLCLYPLQPMDSSYTKDNYEKSFNILDKNNIIYGSDLDEAKTMSHNFKDLENNDVYCFKNYYTLDVKLVTYDKLNTYQESLVVENVKKALYEKFNAREVDFGEEIPYDTMKSVIEEADTRIGSIIFSEPTINTKVLLANGAEYDIDNSSVDTARKNMVAKNILAGTISLFDFNSSYNLEFGQVPVSYYKDKKAGVFNKIHRITTEARIPATSSTNGDYLTKDNGYKLKENEVIQFITPNITSEVSYGTYVNYRFKTTSSEGTVPANTIYQLKGDDSITFVYTNSDDDTETTVKYTANTIETNGNSRTVEYNLIKPSFALRNLDDSDTSITTVKINGVKYQTLGSSQTIDKMIINSTTLTDPTLQCYWIIDNNDNTLFSRNDVSGNKITKILNDGEYFIYKYDSLNILGSGTKLELDLSSLSDPENDFISWTISSGVPVNAETISSSGVTALNSVDAWQTKNTATYPLKISDMQIYSYTEGDSIKLSGWDVDSKYLGNDWVDITEDINISGTTSDGETISLPKLKITEANWQMRSRLDLNCGPNKLQKIYNNHKIILEEGEYDSTGTYEKVADYSLFSEDGYLTPTTFNYNLKLEYLTQLAGGERVEVSSTTESGVKLTLTDGVVALAYNSNGVVYSATKQTVDNSNNELVIEFSSTNFPNKNAYVDLSILSVTDKVAYAMFYLEQGTSSDLIPTITANKSIEDLNTGASGKEIQLIAGVNIIKLNSGVTDLKITQNKDSITGSIFDKLYIYNIKVSNGYNEALTASMNSSQIEEVVDQIKILDTNNVFNYINTPDNSKAMDIKDIMSASALWDYNNIANPFTIAEIDFDKSTIELSKASKAS